MSLKLKNKLFQPLLINLKGRKEPLKLAARAIESLTAGEAESSEIKSLIKSGDIKVLSDGKAKESGKK